MPTGPAALHTAARPGGRPATGQPAVTAPAQLVQQPHRPHRVGAAPRIRRRPHTGPWAPGWRRARRSRPALPRPRSKRFLQKATGPPGPRGPSVTEERRVPTRGGGPGGVRISLGVTGVVHRWADFLSSTSWGLWSCPDGVHSHPCREGVAAGQLAVDRWTTDFHRLWTNAAVPHPPMRCPPPTHRKLALVPSFPQFLHRVVHCSATRRAFSPRRVKGITSQGRHGLWVTGVNLGTHLGRSGSCLCMGCAQLSPVHSEPGLSTGAVHRGSGQNLASDLRKRSCPRFPQALLLPPHS